MSQSHASLLTPSSLNDDAILDLIFNPSQGSILAAAKNKINNENNNNNSSSSSSTTNYSKADEEEISKIRRLEIEAVKAASDGSHSAALSQLSSLILLCSSSSSSPASSSSSSSSSSASSSSSSPSPSVCSVVLPSLYNNRAQVHDLLGDYDSAHTDLSEAITRAQAQTQAHAQAQTQGHNDVLTKALIQRAILRKIKRNDEEGAYADFQAAAKLGSEFAKQEAVRLNPYSALCNQYLSIALKTCTDEKTS